VTRAELLEKISTFSLSAESLAEDLISGDFRSIFRGQGIEFEEVRTYQVGDDIRSIDWNVSARFGHPYVKLYREEREMTVFIILDSSASMRTGGPIRRYDQALFAASLIAFSAEKAGQRFGGLFFNREVSRVLMPKKGRAAVMAWVLEALAQDPADAADSSRGSELAKALEGASRILKKRSLVVIVSDFLALGWEELLANLSHHHDVAAIRITDPIEEAMPRLGLVTFQDPETDEVLHAPTSFKSFESSWKAWNRDRSRVWDAICTKYRVPHMELLSTANPATELVRFFSGRTRQ